MAACLQPSINEEGKGDKMRWRSGRNLTPESTEEMLDDIGRKTTDVSTLEGSDERGEESNARS
jgi:hypothetical protein